MLYLNPRGTAVQDSSIIMILLYYKDKEFIENQTVDKQASN